MTGIKGLITSIEAYRRQRKIIYIDQEPAFILYNREVTQCGLEEGMELPEKLYADIVELILKPRCKKRLLHLLDRYDRTEAQVRDKLREDMYPEETIEEAIAAAKRGRYLDDKRYAFQYTYEKSRKKSRRVIELELKNKGIDEELIKNALSETEDNEEELISRFILKKIPDLNTVSYEEKQKVLAYVCRKGFEPDKCIRVYDRLVANAWPGAK